MDRELATSCFVPEWASLGYDVARATGLVVARVDCSAEYALGLLREHAERQGRSLQEIAVAALDRELRFDPRVAIEQTRSEHESLGGCRG